MTDAVVTTPTQQEAPVTDATTEATPTEQPTAAEIRKMKLKIDGQEMELPEDEVISWAQRGKAGDKAMKEAAQVRKQNQELIRRLKSDPLSLLSDPSLGHDVKKLVSDFIKKDIEEQNLSPEQKEARDLRRKLKEYEDKEAKAKNDEHERAIDEAAAKYEQKLETEITDVCRTSGLPKSPYTVARIAHYMTLAIKEGYDNVSAKDVLPLVKQDYITAQQDLYSAADEDTLIELLGDELLSKASKAYIKKTTKSQTPKVEKSDKPIVVNEKKGEEKPKMSLEKWMRS